MKALRMSALGTLVLLLFVASASATPSISSYSVDNNSCTYTVGGQNQTPCPIGPGSLLTVHGSGFGPSGGIVNTCDCNTIINKSWSNTLITGWVYSVSPNFANGIQVETSGGLLSAAGAAPYTALAAQITEVVVGSGGNACTYIPNQSAKQCLITAGTAFTVYGNYFGAGPVNSGPQIGMCDCTNPTIQSWDPGWTSNPTETGNVIEATAVEAECGNSIVVFAEGAGVLPSNPVPYTTCQ